MNTNEQAPKFYSGLITFTINEGKDPLRKSLLDKLMEEKIVSDMLDQSTYGISDAYQENLIEKIKGICKEAEKESGLKFDKMDSVTFYKAGQKEYREEKEKWDKIAAYKVI